MKTAVVTGVTGFIGSYLCRHLLQADYRVYGIGTDIGKIDSMNFSGDFHPVTADFRVYDNLENYIKDDIDVFYHLAWSGGFTHALKDYKLQLDNAKAACDAILSASKMKSVKKFVYAGTVNQIEINQFMNNERFVPRNTCIYAAAKTAGDMICRTLAHNAGIEYNSALIPLPYGIGNSSPQLINTVIKNCYTGQPSKLITGNNQYDIDRRKRSFYAQLLYRTQKVKDIPRDSY